MTAITTRKAIQMKNRILGIVLFLLTGYSVAADAADAVRFSAEAPRQAVMGQNFRLVYESNTEIEDLRIPELSAYFDVVYGPSTSMSSSTTIINGKYESSTSYSSTYILQPKKTGTFTIPAASATINGQKYKSNTVSIKILPADKQASSGNSDASNAAPVQSSGTTVSNNQVFIRAIPSKTNVREQEGLLVTYKLYFRVDIAGMQNPKFPEFKGFMAQEIEIPEEKQAIVENINGLNYQSVVLKQTYLYPQKTGKLTIDKGSFDLILRIRNQNNRSNNIFDDFFDTYSEVKKTVYCNSLSINVNPLPAGKPANFSGLAGTLTLTPTISSQKIKANEAVTLRLKLSGNGNLKMIPTPEMTFPADFEAYDPKVDNAFKVTTNGVVGTKSIEYLVIPRFPGTFTIPSASVSYFDVKSGSYKTLTSPAYTLTVEKGDGKTNMGAGGSFANQEQLKLVGSDIRYLRKIESVQKETRLYIGSTHFWLFFFLPFAAAIILLLINRKRLKENADIARTRNRKANKVAVKRLRLAHQYLGQGKQEPFYEEVMKALWGYTSDKLDIPLSKLTKETIDSQLDQNMVDKQIRTEFAEILEACEFARFAPGDPTENMDKLYEKTVNVINLMENTLKR